MKSIKRKLLSLLLAMAMVLTLAPTALAGGNDGNDGDGSTAETVKLSSVTITGTTTGQTVAGTYNLSATPTPAEATTPITYTWSVVSGDIEVSSNGAVTCKNTTSTNNVTGTVKCKAEQSSTGESVEATKEVTFTGIPAQQDPVATNISLSPTRATISASADRTTVTGKVLDQNGEEMSGDVEVTKVSGDTATATVSGNIITIDRVGTAAGTNTFTVSAKSDSKVTATLTVDVTAKAASVATATIGITGGVASVAAGSNLNVTVTGISSQLSADAYDKITWTSSDTSILTVSGTTASATVTGVKAGTATVSVSYTKNNVEVAKGTSAVITVTGAPTVYIGVGNSSAVANTYSLAGVGSEATLYVYVNSQTNQSTNYTYTWSVYSGTSVDIATGQYSNTYYQTVRGVSVGTTRIQVTVYAKNTNSVVGTAYIDVTVGNSGLQVSATVYGGADYLLADVDDNGKTSVVSQIEQLVRNTSISRYLNYVVFTATTSVYGDLSANTYTNYYADGISTSNGGRLSDVVFSPKQAGTAYFSFRAYYYNGTTYATPGANDYITGTLAITVSNTVATSDITYTASIGDDVSFDLKDFEDFYYTKTRGTLSYVTFTLPSGGSLYSDRGRLTTSNACYASPTGTQADLGGVYFTPTGTTATRASTVRISFTANGNRSSSSGTVAITYLAGTAKDITYNISTSGTLKASDFTDAYKAVVGSTAPTGLTIQFQTVPTYGTLTYKDSSRTSASTVTLKSSNIKSYNFTTRTSGSYQLGDVTYTASGTRSDTIEYIAYVNSTPQFTGKVVFNGSNASASNMQIAKTSVSGAAVTFSYTDFTTANATVMASCSYIRVVTLPAGGTLTYNGTAVTLSSTNILPALLGSLVYRPSASFNNSTDRFSFLCYDANGNSVGGGQVSIVVTGNTSNSTGATTVSQFKDVTATAWYRNDLITLVNAGIIQGRGDGKFDPTAELTYGEALKIFMLASGYPAQAETTGKDWAINYKNLAVSNGWISSSVDLSTKITRNQMAELAARSLGVSPSNSVPPTWTDGTSNTYANALYYTNPQILIGNADGTFKGTSTLLRQEICAIASRILTYRATQQSVDKPAWLG